MIISYFQKILNHSSQSTTLRYIGIEQEEKVYRASSFLLFNKIKVSFKEELNILKTIIQLVDEIKRILLGFNSNATANKLNTS